MISFLATLAVFAGRDFYYFRPLWPFSEVHTNLVIGCTSFFALEMIWGFISEGLKKV